MYRVVQKTLARLHELATELGASSHNLPTLFWTTLYFAPWASRACRGTAVCSAVGRVRSRFGPSATLDYIRVAGPEHGMIDRGKTTESLFLVTDGCSYRHLREILQDRTSFDTPTLCESTDRPTSKSLVVDNFLSSFCRTMQLQTFEDNFKPHLASEGPGSG